MNILPALTSKSESITRWSLELFCYLAATDIKLRVDNELSNHTSLMGKVQPLPGIHFVQKNNNKSLFVRLPQLLFFSCNQRTAAFLLGSISSIIMQAGFIFNIMLNDLLSLLYTAAASRLFLFSLFFFLACCLIHESLSTSCPGIWMRAPCALFIYFQQKKKKTLRT